MAASNVFYLAVQRIEGVEPILETKFLDEFLCYRDLVGFLVDVDVREDDSPDCAEHAQHLLHPQVAGRIGAALQRRAIDRRRPFVNSFAHERVRFECRRMDAERGFETHRAEAGEQVAQLTLADRRLHAAGEVLLQQLEMPAYERRHAFITMRSAQVSQNTEKQNMRQRVPFSLGPARVRNINKNIQKRD